MDQLVHADEFYRDLEEGTLPTFSYINPECCSIDSMHPTSPMATGEQMVKHLYDALRRSKYWDNASVHHSHMLHDANLNETTGY